jgi:hypothetical protein
MVGRKFIFCELFMKPTRQDTNVCLIMILLNGWDTFNWRMIAIVPGRNRRPIPKQTRSFGYLFGNIVHQMTKQFLLVQLAHFSEPCIRRSGVMTAPGRVSIS